MRRNIRRKRRSMTREWFSNTVVIGLATLLKIVVKQRRSKNSLRRFKWETCPIDSLWIWRETRGIVIFWFWRKKDDSEYFDSEGVFEYELEPEDDAEDSKDESKSEVSEDESELEDDYEAEDKS